MSERVLCAGPNILREIRRYQRSVKHLIPRSVFHRVALQIMGTIGDYKLQSDASLALQVTHAERERGGEQKCAGGFGAVRRRTSGGLLCMRCTRGPRHSTASRHEAGSKPPQVIIFTLFPRDYFPHCFPHDVPVRKNEQGAVQGGAQNLMEIILINTRTSTKQCLTAW